MMRNFCALLLLVSVVCAEEQEAHDIDTGSDVLLLQKSLDVEEDRQLGQGGTGSGLGSGSGSDQARPVLPPPAVCHRSLAVCVTGQLSRFEAKSKVENLIRPNNADVFVVLEPNSYVYVNADTIASADEACQTDVSVANVKASFGQFYRNGSFLNEAAVVPNMSNWPYYKGKAQMDRGTRLASHFNQWAHLSRCARLIKEQEKIDGCQYKNVVKIRDNGIVAKPMHISLKDKLVLKKCASCGGLSDRFFISPRRNLDQVFEGPLRLALKVDNGVFTVPNKKKVKGPEKFLAIVYEHEGVEVEKVENDGTITVVDGRCSGTVNTVERTWCLVSSLKDCHPDGELDYPTCLVEQEVGPPEELGYTDSDVLPLQKSLEDRPLGDGGPNKDSSPATASLANTTAASSASGAVDRRGDVVVVNVGHGTTGTRFLFFDVFCEMGLAGIHCHSKCNWNGTAFPDWPQEGTFTDAASWLAEMREWISRTAHSGNVQYLTDFVGFFPDLVLGELRGVGVQPVLLLSVRDPAAWAEGRTQHTAAPVCRTGAVADALDLSACVERAPNHGRGVDFWSLVQRASTTNQSRLREAIAAYQAKWKPKVNLYVDLFAGERREGPSIKRGLEKCGLVKSAEKKLTFTPQVEAGKPCDI